MMQLSAIGNIGRDAVVRETNGKKVIGFSLAHNESYVDGDGVKHEKTTWINCSLWPKNADNILPYLKKGQRLYVQGNPSVGVYRSDADNQWHADLSMTVKTLEFIGSSESKNDQDTKRNEGPGNTNSKSNDHENSQEEQQD